MKPATAPVLCVNKSCRRILKRLPEIYFLAGTVFYGCETCGIAVRYDIVDIDALENPRIDKRTYQEYMKEFSERLPAGAV